MRVEHVAQEAGEIAAPGGGLHAPHDLRSKLRAILTAAANARVEALRRGVGHAVRRVQ